MDSYCQPDNTDIPQHSQSHIFHSIEGITTNDGTGNAKCDTGGVDQKRKSDVRTLSSIQQISLRHGVTESRNLIKTREFVENVTTTTSKNTGWTKEDCQNKDSLHPKLPVAGTFSHSSNKDNQENPENLHTENKLSLKKKFFSFGDGASKSVSGEVECLDAPSGSYYKKPSSIYGGVDDGPFTIIGSWALQSLSENMQRDFEAPSDLRGDTQDQSCEPGNNSVDHKSVKKHKSDQSKNSATGTGDNGHQWHFQASAGTLFQIRASHIMKITFMLVLVIAVFSFVFHTRIRALEDEKKVLIKELKSVKMHVELLVRRMDDVVSLAIPTRSQQNHFDLATSLNDLQFGENKSPENSNANTKTYFDSMSVISNKNGEGSIKKLAKRSAAPSRTTKELLYSSESVGSNTLNNSTDSYTSRIDEWRVNGGEARATSKGNRKAMKISSQNKFIRRLFRKELRKLRNRLKIKHKLEYAEQLQNSSANLSCCSCCNNDPSQPSHNALIPEQSAFALKNSRAVYLQIDGSSVHIKKPRQLIGPWYLPNSGNDIGFNGFWYNRLNLDSNGTSIIFQESGLYLISAQVFYQLQRLHNSKPIPMGYRIHLKKNGKENQPFRRPLTIAECVPSFPSTVYQTCFTQVAWYVEHHDEVYLEHFTESLPMIEALRSGQTFLGLVKLS